MSSPAGSRTARLVRGVAIGLAVAFVFAVVALLREPTVGVPGDIPVAGGPAVAAREDRPAPSFELPALDGAGTIGLGDFAGRVVVLNFWASWCAPCRDEAPHLQAIWEDYRDRGIQVLGVDYRDDRFAGQEYEREFGITYPSVFDPAGELAFDYEVRGVPTTIVIGADGRIAFRFTGRIDGASLRRALDEVLRNG